MSKETAIILLGLVVVLTPLSGFPESWRAALIFLAGAGVFAIGCSMRMKGISMRTRHNTFTESRGGFDDAEPALKT